MTDKQIRTLARWPLDTICLNTIFKVHDFSVSHNKGDTPHYQIDVGGFVMVDCGGAILFGDIQLSAEDGDTEKVGRMRAQFTPGSLHHVKAKAFYYCDKTIQIFNPEAKPVSSNEYESINSFFPVKVSEGREPAAGEFYYAGEIFIEGRGDFKGFKVVS